MDEEVLAGGVANSGAVTRVGDEVRRPASAFTKSIFALLESLRGNGFDGVQTPHGIDELGRERLSYVTGEVAFSPYPEWAQTDEVLASITRLLRRFHDASRGFSARGLCWSNELADRHGGSVMCHNDVCLENVIFRDGAAVALIDFDFAAPGRRVHDLAQFTKMCVPLEEDANAAQLGWARADLPGRLRLVADVYGLDVTDRADLFVALEHEMATCGEFVLRHVEAEDAGFVRMWNEGGGAEFYERRKRWWAVHAGEFRACLR